MNANRRAALKPTSNYLKRIAAFQEKMRQAKLDVCLIDQPLDLFYFTGMQLSVGQLVIHRNGVHLFVDGRYIAAAQSCSPVKTSLYKEADLAAFLQKCKAKKLGFDSAHISYDQVIKLEALLNKHNVSARLIAVGSLFKTIRLIKDAAEIKQLRSSADLLYKGFQYLRTQLKVGVTEGEVAQAFEIFCLQQGAEGMAFEPIVAFGANSAMPHYRAGKAKLRKGDPILIDIGVIVGHYHSDMTRMLFFQKIDPFIGSVYEVVRSAQAAALELCRPGEAVGKLDEAARAVMRRYKMESAFMHSLGHGIGLETHESPRIKWDGEEKDVILEPGMVVTIEPGLYFPGRGGVRYEDTVVITKKGYQNFFPEMKKKEVIVR